MLRKTRAIFPMIALVTILPLLVLIFLFVCAVPAIAVEVLELDGGSISLTSPRFFAHANLTGPRLSISASQQMVIGTSGYGFVNCEAPNGGCHPGVISVGGGGVGRDFVDGSGGGTATLDGVTHGLGAGNGPFDGDILSLFVTGSVLLPEFGNIESVVLAAPFDLTGQLFRADADCVIDPNPFPHRVCSGPPFSGTPYSLHGQGILHLTLHRENLGFGDFWQWDSGQFDLQPTPEPTTLLLWGTSAAGLGLARWVKRRRASGPGDAA